MDKERRMEYEAPEVTTVTAEEILEELGPAQASEYMGPDDLWELSTFSSNQ